MSEPKTHVTSARKRIGRTIQTKQFESVNISIEVEDEIEWTTIDERQRKLSKLTQLAILDYEETAKQVCAALGVEEKRVFVKDNGPKSAAPPPRKENALKKDVDKSAGDILPDRKQSDDDDVLSMLDGLE